MLQTFSACLHRDNGTSPSIRDAFTERNDVVEHLIGDVGIDIDACSGIQNLRNRGEVKFKLASNRLSNVAKALQDSWFKLVAQKGTLCMQSAVFIKKWRSKTNPKVFEQVVHKVVAVWLR